MADACLLFTAPRRTRLHVLVLVWCLFGAVRCLLCSAVLCLSLCNAYAMRVRCGACTCSSIREEDASMQGTCVSVVFGT